MEQEHVLHHPRRPSQAAVARLVEGTAVAVQLQTRFQVSNLRSDPSSTYLSHGVVEQLVDTYDGLGVDLVVKHQLRNEGLPQPLDRRRGGIRTASEMSFL